MSKKYICQGCNFSTNSTKDWKRHLDTKKHQKLNNKNKINNEWQCPVCNLVFGSRTTLWRHKKQCEETTQSLVSKEENKDDILCDDVNKIVDIPIITGG